MSIKTYGTRLRMSAFVLSLLYFVAGGAFVEQAFAHTPAAGGPTYDKLRAANQGRLAKRLEAKVKPAWLIKKYKARALSAAENKKRLIGISNAMTWKYSLPLGLQAAVCDQESRWNETAVSYMGAVGVCQIMPATFRQLIRRYQSENGLRVDGAIGPETWGVMRPGIPFKYKTNMQRLYTGDENIEWSAYYLRWIMDNVTTDPAVLLAVYYAGQRHPVVRYMLEVDKRWKQNALK